MALKISNPSPPPKKKTTTNTKTSGISPFPTPVTHQTIKFPYIKHLAVINIVCGQHRYGISLRLTRSMVVEMVPLKGGIGGIVHPPIGSKNTTYIPLIVLAFWGVICYRSHLLGEPFQQPLTRGRGFMHADKSSPDPRDEHFSNESIGGVDRYLG